MKAPKPLGLPNMPNTGPVGIRFERAMRTLSGLRMRTPSSSPSFSSMAQKRA